MKYVLSLKWLLRHDKNYDLIFTNSVIDMDRNNTPECKWYAIYSYNAQFNFLWTEC